MAILHAMDDCRKWQLSVFSPSLTDSSISTDLLTIFIFPAQVAVPSAATGLSYNSLHKPLQTPSLSTPL